MMKNLFTDYLAYDNSYGIVGVNTWPTDFAKTNGFVLMENERGEMFVKDGVLQIVLNNGLGAKLPLYTLQEKERKIAETLADCLDLVYLKQDMNATPRALHYTTEPIFLEHEEKNTQFLLSSEFYAEKLGISDVSEDEVFGLFAVYIDGKSVFIPVSLTGLSDEEALPFEEWYVCWNYLVTGEMLIGDEMALCTEGGLALSEYLDALNETEIMQIYMDKGLVSESFWEDEEEYDEEEEDEEDDEE